MILDRFDYSIKMGIGLRKSSTFTFDFLNFALETSMLKACAGYPHIQIVISLTANRTEDGVNLSHRNFII